MSNHISQEDWILFCSGEMTLPEKMPILRHCAECSVCRALMDAANDLRFAAARSESASEIGNFMDEQAYRAVAGKNGPQAVSGTKGYLSFRLESTENGYCFADEDPAADGFGNRYAMNRSPDGRQFLEDAGALSLQITGAGSFCSSMIRKQWRQHSWSLTEASRLQLRLEVKPPWTSRRMVSANSKSPLRRPERCGSALLT